MSASSVSEMTMYARVPARGEFTAKLYKHLSPVTLTKIQHALPLNGRVTLFEKSFVYILTNVIAGEEKSRREFKRGEVAFVPAGSMICFFLQATKSQKPMNPLGEIQTGLEVLENCRRGDSILIESIVSSALA